MANTAANVQVASTGRVCHAPTTTALPTDAVAALNVAFKELGYISEDGVTEAEGTSENKIKAWQAAAVVRKVRTEHDLTYKFDCIEGSNDEVISVAYQNGTAAAYEITGTMPGYEAFVIEAVDDNKVIRIVVPNGQVTEIGERKYAGTEASSLPLTVTAYPDASGVKAYHYEGTDESW